MFVKSIEDQNTKNSEQASESINNENAVNCRICFNEMQKIEVSEICRCKKQESSIHIKCLSRWIENAPLYKRFPNRFYIICPTCESKIDMNCFVTYECLPWKKIQFLGKNMTCSISAMVIFMIGLIIIGISLGLFLYKNLDPTFEMMGIISLIIGLLIAIINLVIYVFHVCMEEKVTIMGMRGLDLQILKQSMDQKEQQVQNKALINADSSLVSFQLSLTVDQMLYSA